jgi:hypothetical protein
MTRAQKAKAKEYAGLVEGDWTERQRTYLAGEVERLQVALDKNLGILTDGDDPRWRKWFEQRAKAVHIKAILDAVEKRGHWLACPTHGPMGIETPPEAADGLASYGLAQGGEWYEYTFYCERCAGLAAEVQREWEVWQKMARAARA